MGIYLILSQLYLLSKKEFFNSEVPPSLEISVLCPILQPNERVEDMRTHNCYFWSPFPLLSFRPAKLSSEHTFFLYISWFSLIESISVFLLPARQGCLVLGLSVFMVYYFTACAIACASLLFFVIYAIYVHAYFFLQRSQLKTSLVYSILVLGLCYWS